MSCFVRVALVLVSAAIQPAFAGVINFDSLNDGDLVTSQFAGLSFQNAVVLTSGVSLNELEFPPHSDFNVISDNGGPISILFGTPQSLVFAYFTYLQPITFAAFDASSNLLGSTTSNPGCSSNLALSGAPGCSPNELLTLTGLGAISSVVVTGNPAGGSFVLDDLNVNVSAVPEPSTFSLLAGCLGAWVVCRRLKGAR